MEAESGSTKIDGSGSTKIDESGSTEVGEADAGSDSVIWKQKKEEEAPHNGCFPQKTIFLLTFLEVLASEESKQLSPFN